MKFKKFPLKEVNRVLIRMAKFELKLRLRDRSDSEIPRILAGEEIRKHQSRPYLFKIYFSRKKPPRIRKALCHVSFVDICELTS